MQKQRVKRSQFPVSSYESVIKMLIDSGTPHKTEITRNRRLITILNAEYSFSETSIDPKNLNFIKQTKRLLIEAKAEHTTASDVNFFFVGANNGATHFLKNVVEVDITKAYWFAAYHLGYINKNHLDKGLEIDKVSRLVAIGSAATIKWSMNFDGREYTNFEESISPEGRNAFFTICKRVSAAISSAMGDTGFLAWVDAVFCPADEAERVEAALEDFGFTSKRKNIRWAWFRDLKECKKMTFMEVGKETEKMTEIRIKTFTFAKRHAKSGKKTAKELHKKAVENVLSNDFSQKSDNG